MRLTRLKQKLWDQKFLLLMVIPGVIWMLVFNYAPMTGIVIAFKDYKITKPISEAEWAGMKYLMEFFADDRFFLVLKNTLGISFLKLIFGFPLPILFAIMLNEIRHARFKKSIQTISYLPHFLSWVVLGGIMTTWLSESGLFNEILLGAGILQEPIPFLAKPEYFWGVTIISDIWKELGWNAIIYLAAISGIDPSMYEAATVDGAGRWRKIWNITLPSIAGTITILLILAVGNMMRTNFDQIFVLRNTLNADASDVIDIFVYKMGIQNGRHSFATAAELFKSVISVILLTVTNAITKKLSNTSLF